MGNKQPSLFDVAFDLKFKGKQLERTAKRMERDIKKEKLKVKQYIQNGDLETAKIFAQNAIRKKNERTNMFRLAARIQASASQIEDASRTQDVGKLMGRVVKGLDISMEKMNVDSITGVMDKFERRMEDMNVINEYQSQAMETTATVNSGQVDDLLGEVISEYNIKVSEELEGLVPKKPIQQPTQKVAESEEDDLEKRYANLQQFN